MIKHILLLILLMSCHEDNDVHSVAPIVPPSVSPTTSENGSTPAPVLPTPPTEDIVVGEILQAMEICGAKASDGRKIFLARQLFRITTRYMPERHLRDAFVGLVCIESKFVSDAKSTAGAVGLAQIMPKLAPYFAQECGLGDITAADLLDSEVNLTIGACHFSKLLTAFDGNIALALAGYNSGQDSTTTKRLAVLAEGHPETMAYVAKFYAYINKLQIAREEKK